MGEIVSYINIYKLKSIFINVKMQFGTTWEWIGAGVPNGLQNRFGELVASRVSSILTHSRHLFMS